MIIGQVAVMRLLSALFFLLPQNGGNRKCHTCLVRSLPAGQFSGDWGMPTNKRSPFCTKGHCLPLYQEFLLPATFYFIIVQNYRYD